MDLPPFNTDKLIKTLLSEHWHKHCEIIPDYMPPHPHKDTRPTVKVKCGEWFLRCSHGPIQGYFWDIYGDDLSCVEYAIIALSKSQAPPNFLPYYKFEFKIEENKND